MVGIPPSLVCVVHDSVCYTPPIYWSVLRRGPIVLCTAQAPFGIVLWFRLFPPTSSHVEGDHRDKD